MMKITNGEMVKKYDEEIVKLANAINEVTEVYNRLDFLSKEADDNGDPAFLLNEALTKLGPALAMAISYRTEYAAEDPKKNCREHDQG